METPTLTLDLQRLKEAREAAGLTQEEVARRLGLSGKQAVSNFETGFSQPRPEALVRLCRLYNITAESLFA